MNARYLHSLRRRLEITPDRLYFACTLVGAANLVLFCTAATALLRVLRAAARDAHNTPRRRLLELDDGVARRGPGCLGRLCAAYRPWTTQKALLAMVAFAAALRVAWCVLASHAWDAGVGVVRELLSEPVRVIFYALDFFEAAATFNLYTIVARFWAELACAARQGTIATRPLGGGDEYRPRGTPPLLWKLTKPVQRASCLIAYAAAGIATLLQATIWNAHVSYVGVIESLVESGGYILAALVMATFAHYAIVELRLVPIELPTRRRRVYRITAVTAICSTCLVVRAGFLISAANRPFPVNENVEVVALMSYFLVLETLPLAVVLAYNRTAPSTASRPTFGRGGSARRRASPEEEPLIGGTGRPFNSSNPFATHSEIPRAVVHR